MGMLLLPLVFAINVQTVYNPWTGKLDFIRQSNFSGDNLTATFFFGNISWESLYNYPASCPADTFITSLGDATTCTAVVNINSTGSISASNFQENGTNLTQKYLKLDGGNQGLWTPISTKVTNLHADLLDGYSVGTLNAIPVLNGSNTWTKTQTFGTGSYILMEGGGQLFYPDIFLGFGSSDEVSFYYESASSIFYMGQYGVPTTVAIAGSPIELIGVTYTNDMYPKIDNTYSLGSTAIRYKNGYFINLNTSQINGTEGRFSKNLSVNGSKVCTLATGCGDSSTFQIWQNDSSSVFLNPEARTKEVIVNASNFTFTTLSSAFNPALLSPNVKFIVNDVSHFLTDVYVGHPLVAESQIKLNAGLASPAINFTQTGVYLSSTTTAGASVFALSTSASDIIQFTADGNTAGGGAQFFRYTDSIGFFEFIRNAGSTLGIYTNMGGANANRSLLFGGFFNGVHRDLNLTPRQSNNAWEWSLSNNVQDISMKFLMPVNVSNNLNVVGNSSSFSMKLMNTTALSPTCTPFTIIANQTGFWGCNASTEWTKLDP